MPVFNFPLNIFSPRLLSYKTTAAFAIDYLERRQIIRVIFYCHKAPWTKQLNYVHVSRFEDCALNDLQILVEFCMIILGLIWILIAMLRHVFACGLNDLQCKILFLARCLVFVRFSVLL